MTDLALLHTADQATARAFFADSAAEDLVAAIRSTSDDELLALIGRDHIRPAAVEGITHVSNLCFKQAAQAAGIPIGWHNWTVGLHTVPYMNRSMKAYLPILMKYFHTHGH